MEIFNKISFFVIRRLKAANNAIILRSLHKNIYEKFLKTYSKSITKSIYTNCLSCVLKLLTLFRRMFPTVRVSFSGPLRQIQPPDRYAVLIDIVPMDSRRYRYAYHRSSWLVAGKADPPPPARLYAHPDSPISVDALRKQVVSFEKVKLTNNEMDKSGQVNEFAK